MRLYLVRHGQTSWNLAGRAQGQTDIALDSTGLEQAEALGRAFAGVEVSRILSSDLSRAAQTAEPISRVSGVAIEARLDLRERSFGEYEGLDFRDFSARVLEQALERGVNPKEIRPPAGESFGDVWQRLETVSAELREIEGPTVVVTHGGTCAVLLARLLNATLATSFSFRFGNTAVTELELRPDGVFSLMRYDDARHLADARPLSGSLHGTSR